MLFSLSVMSGSLQPHGLQHARLLCPSLSPRVCSLMSRVGDTYNHFVLCHSLLLLSMFPSIRGNELTLHTRWPMYWSFSFNTSPSNEYSGLISFRMDWLDLLAVLTCWHLTLVTLQEVCLLLNSPAFILFCPWPRWPFSSWNLRHLWYSLHYFSLKGERN